MKMLFSLLFLVVASLFSSTAFSRTLPGPPPWGCDVYSACNINEQCVRLFSFPISSFHLYSDDPGLGDYFFKPSEGHEFNLVTPGRKQSKAASFSSLEKATKFLKGDASRTPTRTILVPSDFVEDAHGFSAYGVFWNSKSGYRIGTDHMRIICNQIR